jgi:hypothetical protein
MAADASPRGVELAEIRRILASLCDERSSLHPERDAVLLAANAIAIRYWREALAAEVREPLIAQGPRRATRTARRPATRRGEGTPFV